MPSRPGFGGARVQTYADSPEYANATLTALLAAGLAGPYADCPDF
jgi:hypothetical protein